MTIIVKTYVMPKRLNLTQDVRHISLESIIELAMNLKKIGRLNTQFMFYLSHLQRNIRGKLNIVSPNDIFALMYKFILMKNKCKALIFG